MSTIHWRRSLAWQLDWMLCIIIIQAIAYLFSIKSFQSAIIPNIGLHANFILGFAITTHILSLSMPSIDMVIPIVFFLLYRSIMESSKQQASVGHMFFGLRVVDSFNNKVSFLTSMLRNFLIFISSLILFLDCWKSLRSSSTWHDRATNTTTEIVSSVDSRDRGLAILYLCAFGYVAWISTRTNRYVDWLSQYTDSMNSEQIQQQKNMVQLAHAVIQSTIYSSLTIVIIGLLFLCKSFLFNKVNVRKNWILRREAYLAIGAFLMPALLIMLTVGFSLYILYEQNQALINSIPR